MNETRLPEHFSSDQMTPLIISFPSQLNLAELMMAFEHTLTIYFSQAPQIDQNWTPCGVRFGIWSSFQSNSAGWLHVLPN